MKLSIFTAINNASSDLTYQSSQPSFDVLFSRSSVSGGYVWTVLRDFYISVTNSGSAGVALLKKGDSFRCSDNHMNIGLGGFTIYISGTSYTVRVTSSNSGISYGTSSSGFRIWY